ncbi:MAG TPA: hypothetical protein VL172_02185, partial [Kofleriaceae bacterium]|nr:hypothetical protein [Kofleriaceae bacterium]
MSCWGVNSNGALGDGLSASRENPALVAGSGGWRTVTAGDGFTCAIHDADGHLYCWGRDDTGAGGNGWQGASLVPSDIGYGLGWNQVDAGQLHACAISAQSYLYCWGWAAYGQIGDNQTTTNRDQPALVTGLPEWQQVSAGGRHSCAIKTEDGSLWCWGDDSTGQLGRGIPGSPWPTPYRVGSDGGWTTVSAGTQHTCAIRGARLYCWGDNSAGQLAADVVGASGTPLEVAGGAVCTAVAAGRALTCALRDDGSLWCWGDAEWGQVGDGGAAARSEPVPVAAGTAFQWLAAGPDHTCAATAEGTLSCWGKNSGGQLAIAAWAVKPAPISEP